MLTTISYYKYEKTVNILEQVLERRTHVGKPDSTHQPSVFTRSNIDISNPPAKFINMQI